MKILLLSEGRTGSYSVMKWIQEHFKYEIISEVKDNQSYDYKNNDNFIIKKTLSNNDFNLNDIIYFDKVIILYRENTLEQAESSLYAILKQKWHHTDGTNDGHYVISNEFLNNNRENILSIKYQYDRYLKIYKQLDFGLKITYEDIFINKIGQKKLEEYLEINAITELHTNFNKLRIITN